jgi:PAS domain S-box-containing protein
MDSKNGKKTDGKSCGERPLHGINSEANCDKDKNSEDGKGSLKNLQTENIAEYKVYINNLRDEIQALNRKLEFYAAEQERLNFITNHFTDFVFLILVIEKNKFKLEWINKNFNNEMGYPFETLLDAEKSRNVLHDHDYLIFQEALAKSLDGETLSIEIRLLRSQDNMTWYNFAFYPMCEENMSNVTMLYGACRNISQRKKEEYELQKLNNELKMLVEEKTVLFENAVKKFQDDINLPFLLNGSRAYKNLLNDITETKSTNEQLRILSSAVEQISSGILLTDINGLIKYVNPEMTKITGFYKEELIGHSSRIFKSGRQSEEIYKELWDTILAGSNWSGELENKKKSGEYYSEFVSISPIKNDEGVITNFLAIIEDITDRKKIAEELIKSKSEAEEANKAKSLLIANISHELRTPLNVVLGFAQLLSENIINIESSEIIEKITYSGKRLLHTLNLVLASTELESKDYLPNYTEIDLQFLCTYIKSLYEPQTAEKNLKFELALPKDELIILSDEYLLSGILTNIVENAIKYTKTGLVRIELKANVQYDGEEFTLINIKDTGIGIKKEDYEIIFREFRQASEGFHRDFEGLGLGLSLAHKMAKLLNIKILVESELSKGSNFSIMIPSNKSLIPLNKKPDSIAKQNINLLSPQSHIEKHLKILLVEDNLLNVEVVELFLKKYWDISSVNNGEDAISSAKQSNYDLFLIDINLGHGMDGIEVLNRIKQIHSYQKTPSIAITGYASEKYKKLFLEHGFTNYLAKPFGKNELIDLIKDVVKMN